MNRTDLDQSLFSQITIFNRSLSFLERTKFREGQSLTRTLFGLIRDVLPDTFADQSLIRLFVVLYDSWILSSSLDDQGHCHHAVINKFLDTAIKFTTGNRVLKVNCGESIEDLF